LDLKVLFPNIGSIAGNKPLLFAVHSFVNFRVGLQDFGNVPNEAKADYPHNTYNYCLPEQRTFYVNGHFIDGRRYLAIFKFGCHHSLTIVVETPDYWGSIDIPSYFCVSKKAFVKHHTKLTQPPQLDQN